MELRALIMVTEDVFQIDGRGTVITGIPGPRADLVRRNLAIELHTPTGTLIENSIAEVEMFRDCFSEGRIRPLGLLLAQSVPSDQLPKGTKVLYADRAKVV